MKTASKSSEASAASHIATRSFGFPAPMTTPRLGTLRPKRTVTGGALRRAIRARGEAPVG